MRRGLAKHWAKWRSPIVSRSKHGREGERWEKVQGRMLKKRTRGKSCTFQQPWELSIHPTLPGPRYPSTPQRSHLKRSFTDVKSSKVNMQLTMSKSQSGKQHFVCEQPIPHHVPDPHPHLPHLPPSGMCCGEHQTREVQVFQVKG